MDKIETSVQIFSELIKIYSETSFKEDLENKREAIILAFKKLLEDNAEKYDLLVQNSVHKKYLFEFDPRIKKAVSLYEKFIRRNDGLRIIHKLELNNSSDVEAKKSEVEKELKLFEDIIGIKIITELRKDVKNVYNLLTEYQDFLSRHKHIDFVDLLDQPKAMKNGLWIYNIKGIYNKEYAFELQIKSKIYSAWTDMDHSFFYKDYSMTPIRDTVQVAMNRIGRLLTQLEKFLYDLRISQEDYIKKAKLFEYVNRFNKEIKEGLSKKLNSDYNFEKLVPILIHILDKFKNNQELLCEIQFGFLELVPKEVHNQNYLAIRNEDFELIFLEIIYLNWKTKYELIKIDEDNYDAVLTTYLELLIELLVNVIKETEKPFEEDSINEFVRKQLYFLMQYSKSSKCLLVSENYVKIFKINTLFIDHKDDFEDFENFEEMQQQLLYLYNLALYKINPNLYCESLENITEISKVIFKINQNAPEYCSEYDIIELEELTKFLLDSIQRKDK